MIDGTKIKTMRDDLLEIESKLSQPQNAPTPQRKATTFAPKTPASRSSSSSSPSAAPKLQASNLSAAKPSPMSQDPKTKELRDIMEKLSKKSGVGYTEKKAQTPETDELKNLIERISKREGGREKSVNAVPIADSPKPKSSAAERPAPIETAKPVSPSVKPAPIIKESLNTAPIIANKPTQVQEKAVSLEKPDLDALIKPVQKPSIKPVTEKMAFSLSPKKIEIIAPQIPRTKNTKSKPEQKAKFEVKAEEIKEILNNITEKETELKDLLDKMSVKKKNETEERKPSVIKNDALSDVSSKTIPREANIKPQSAQLEKTNPKEPAKNLRKTNTPVFAPKPKIDSMTKSGAAENEKEKPIMKKVRERLFGIGREKNATTPAQNNLQVKPVSLEEKNKPDQTGDYLKDITASDEVREPEIGKVEEKFSNLPDAKQVSEMKLDKIEKFENASGVLTNNPDPNGKKENELAKARRNYIDSNYVPPTNRLVFGKQEHYSSIRKHIEERHQGTNLDDLESKMAVGNNFVLSEKEEKRKLKERIMNKYHIKNPSLIKNILIISILAIAMGGGALYLYLTRIPATPPDVTAPAAPGIELKELSMISDSIDISEEKMKNPAILREEANKKFSSNQNLRFFKLVIKDSKNYIVKFDNALKAIGMKTELLPENFLDSAENEYSMLVFKTNKSTSRLGFAVKLKSEGAMLNSMNLWEKDKDKMKDVLAPLYMSDRTSEIQNSRFQSGNYKNVNIRFIPLPDKDTAIDYFIYKNILVITTTKDDAFGLIDILVSLK